MSLTLGLSRIKALLSSLGSPHLRVPCVHIAGTNGKGSVSAFLDSILRHAGCSTGRFNSPHFLQPSDAILLNGSAIPESTYRTLSERVRRSSESHGIEASPFEVLTATAFLAFAEAAVSVALLEVGLGGAEDATNVLERPLLAVLTPIDLDHQAILGDTVVQIAKHKAGIIKDGVPVVLSPQKHVEAATTTVQQVAREHSSAVVDATPVTEDFRWKDLQLDIPLPGPHQLENAGTALTAAEVLRSSSRCLEMLPQLANIRDEHLVQGIKTTRWPGRLEWLRVPSSDGKRIVEVLADGAHNPASAHNLRAFVDALHLKRGTARTTWILGCSSPRLPASLLAPLVKSGDTVIACQFTTQPEGMPWVHPTDAQLVAHAAQAQRCDHVRCTRSIREAIEVLSEDNSVLSEEDSVIVVAGSLYLVADLYRLPDVQAV